MHAALSLILLGACPLGMAGIAGIPALIRRVRGRGEVSASTPSARVASAPPTTKAA